MQILESDSTLKLAAFTNLHLQPQQTAQKAGRLRGMISLTVGASRSQQMLIETP